MPSFHADPDCSLTAAPSVPTLVKTAGHSTARILSGSLTGSHLGQTRPAKIPVLRKLRCAGTTCVTDCVSWELSCHSSHSCAQPGLLILLYLTMLWPPPLQPGTPCDCPLPCHHLSDNRGVDWMFRPPSQCDPATPPGPHLASWPPPAPSCITMYKLRLHSSSPHSPALLFVLVYLFHVKNLMLQFFLVKRRILMKWENLKRLIKKLSPTFVIQILLYV